jgi:hypothetical protein
LAVPAYGQIRIFRPKLSAQRTLFPPIAQNPLLSAQGRPDPFVWAEPYRHISICPCHCYFILSLHGFAIIVKSNFTPLGGSNAVSLLTHEINLLIVITKKTKRTKHPELASTKKKKLPKKKKASTKMDGNNKKHSTSFSPEELLLVEKAFFMKVSSNLKHGTDKKMEKFWEDIHLHNNELVTTSNKINESNTEYVPVEIHNMESLHNCWQRRLQPTV